MLYHWLSFSARRIHLTSRIISLIWNTAHITAIEIPNSVKVINQYAFYNSTGLTSITLGNAITDIGDCAFYNCTKLKKLYCRSSNPPLLGSAAIPTTIGIIYVPRTSVDEYKALWSEYANKIVGYDFE